MMIIGVYNGDVLIGEVAWSGYAKEIPLNGEKWMHRYHVRVRVVKEQTDATI